MSQETWKERQQRVLRGFRDARNLKRADIVRTSGLTYWQVTGIETGESNLPAEWIPALARAYGVAPLTLIEELGLSWSPRAAMEAVGFIDPRRIDQVEADCRDLPEPAQRARVAGEIALGPDPDAIASERKTEHRRRAI